MKSRVLFAALVAAVMTGCGGGSSNDVFVPGGGASDDGPIEGTVGRLGSLGFVEPRVAAVGDPVGSIFFNPVYSADEEDPYTGDIYLRVAIPEMDFTNELVRVNGGSDVSFLLALPIPEAVTAGDYELEVICDICLDAKCRAIADSPPLTVVFTYTVNPVPSWETHQGNAAHTAYVPILVDASSIEESWTWSRPESGEPIGGINAVAAANGTLYVTDDVYFGDATLRAFQTSDGNPLWDFDFGNIAALNPPAVGDGAIYVAQETRDTSDLIVISEDTGNEIRRMALSGQWPHWFPPTIYDGKVYQGSGYYGGQIAAFSTQNGDDLFLEQYGGGWDMYTPAADETGLYHHTGEELLLLDPTDGTVLTQIDDDPDAPTGYARHAAPMIFDNGFVGSYTGMAFSGRASANTEQWDQRYYTAFDIDREKIAWVSDRQYLTQPATANDSIYISGNSPATLDVIQATTGELQWSWEIPEGWPDTAFHRNIVVTDNVLFFSTDQRVIGLNYYTKEVVFTHPAPGMIAITDDRSLVIVEGARESTGDLAVYKGL